MAAALAEYRRVLADGGLLLLAVHAGQEVWHSADWFGAKVDVLVPLLRPRLARGPNSSTLASPSNPSPAASPTPAPK